MATPNCGTCVMSFRMTCYMFTILPPICFSCSFSLSSLCQLEQVSHLQQSPVPLQFPLPVWLLLLLPHPLIGPLIFRDLVYLYWLVDPGQVLLCRAHIASQELQAIAMMLHSMAFHLPGKMVALHLDSITAKAYLCNKGGTVSPFLSRLACWILSLTNKYSITLIPAYIPTHLNVKANYWMLPEWHLLPQVAQLAFQPWGLPVVDLLASSLTTQCLHYYTLESPLPLGALG